MGRIVIVAFQPKPETQERLAEIVRRHWQILRSENLVTDRPAVLMHTDNGTIVEVFEWQSKEAIEQAHQNPVVQSMWSEFQSACDYVPLASLPESQHLFAEFSPLL